MKKYTVFVVYSLEGNNYTEKPNLKSIINSSILQKRQLRQSRMKLNKSITTRTIEDSK